MAWGQATLYSAWAEGTGQVPLLPTLGEEGLSWAEGLWEDPRIVPAQEWL